MAEGQGSEAWWEAVWRIEEAARSGAEILDLSGLGFTAIPEYIAELAQLRSLNLTGNAIRVIPEYLTGLAQLQVLSLEYNDIKEIPDSFARLAKLRELRLGFNEISVIPDSFGGLVSLEELHLCENRITVIPNTLAQLDQLRLLDLSHNKIGIIPELLAGFSQLQELYLIGNRITEVPDSLVRLTNVRQIGLDRNPLAEELLAAARRGVESLFRYLGSTAARKVHPRTVKLVLLGEPRSGKTTLLEALNGNPKPCDPTRQETLGVDVVTIEKDHPADPRPMYLSVWDFAGQHIEHATHQFFLTENAIYLILWNARQGTESGKRDLWYWLELLKMRVREPKFLLVATHTEHTPPDLNLAEIDRAYKGCQGNFAVDLESLNGFDALQDKILELALESPSLRAAWPEAWLPVRNEIRSIRRSKPYVSPADFRRLMKDKGVMEPQAQRDLGNQLHDLGEILYFQERDELSSLVILNPEWVTELIALVVRSKEVREQNGILRSSDLDHLWEEADLEPKVREHLVHLMDWFDLTYYTGHQTDVGIVVEALPYLKTENLTEIDLTPGRPEMEMIFRFPSLQRRLPPGIPTWGIARAHRFSKRKPWRDAAVFEDRGTNSDAVIRALETAKEIRLRVAADYPPFFFGRMEAILRDTFKRYKGAEPERRLPCPCEPGCSHSFLFDTVLKRFRDGKENVTCDRSGEDVALTSLLTGFPRPDSKAGRLAFESEMRRLFTEQLRTQRERMEKTCPSVFTLVPSRGFKQLDTWLESVTKGEELELALYCEHESGWHPTSHSLYRFRADQNWLGVFKEHWNGFVAVTKRVGPLAKMVGTASGVPWAEIAIPVSRTEFGKLSSALGEKDSPEFIDIDTRHLLKGLIEHLDSQRPETEPKNGGLHDYLVDDGRLLWLCPEHLKLYRGRERG